jgi:hypothetical protein
MALKQTNPNLFEFAKNGPLEFVDPMGLICWDEVINGGLDIAGVVLGLAALSAAEYSTAGLVNLGFGAGAVTWGTLNAPINIIGGLSDNPNPLPANPGYALGSLFGPSAEGAGGIAWDAASLLSDSGAIASGENLGLNSAQLGVDTASTVLDISGSSGGGGGGGNLGNIGLGIPTINGGLGLPNPSPPPATPLWPLPNVSLSPCS